MLDQPIDMASSVCVMVVRFVSCKNVAPVGKVCTVWRQVVSAECSLWGIHLDALLLAKRFEMDAVITKAVHVRSTLDKMERTLPSNSSSTPKMRRGEVPHSSPVETGFASI